MSREEFDKAMKHLESLDSAKTPHYWFPITTEEQAEYCRSVGITPVMVSKYLNPNDFWVKELLENERKGNS